MSTVAIDLPHEATLRNVVWARTWFDSIAEHGVEIVASAFFDPEWRLLGLRHQAGTAVDRATLNVREVVRDALLHDARHVILAHNHPSGDATPSRDDIAVTARIARTLDAISVTLADHLILSAGATVSFRQLGLL